MRVTAVGQQLFPVVIRARTPTARVDWRRDYANLDYEIIEVPDDVAAALRRYLKASDLAFAAFDLVRTTAGEHYFLEARPASRRGNLMTSATPLVNDAEWRAYAAALADTVTEVADPGWG